MDNLLTCVMFRAIQGPAESPGDSVVFHSE